MPKNPADGIKAKSKPHFSIDNDLMEKLEMESNKSGLINRLLRSHYQEYAPGLRYPDALVVYLWQRVQEGDEAAKEHLDYIESSAIDAALDKLMADGVIQTPSGAYII